jgi:hypothetical protein
MTLLEVESMESITLCTHELFLKYSTSNRNEAASSCLGHQLGKATMNALLSIIISKEPNLIGSEKMEENIKVQKEPHDQSKRDY